MKQQVKRHVEQVLFHLLALLMLALASVGFATIEVVPLPTEPPDIPAGHLPPPGECRVWLPNQPPGQQPPPGSCAELASNVPLGAWLIYRASPEAIEISAYSTEVEHLVGEVAFYDANTLARLEGPPAPLSPVALELPKGHLPPPGECRIWYPAQPPGQQPPPGSCAELGDEVPVGAWLIYRSDDAPGQAVVTAYHPEIKGLVLLSETFEVR